MNRLLLCLIALAAVADCTTTGVICTESETRCGNTCANLQTHPAFCGQCGIACATGLECHAGACACPAGQTLGGGFDQIGDMVAPLIARGHAVLDSGI